MNIAVCLWYYWPFCFLKSALTLGNFQSPSLYYLFLSHSMTKAKFKNLDTEQKMEANWKWSFHTHTIWQVDMLHLAPVQNWSMIIFQNIFLGLFLASLFSCTAIIYTQKKNLSSTVHSSNCCWLAGGPDEEEEEDAFSSGKWLLRSINLSLPLCYLKRILLLFQSSLNSIHNSAASLASGPLFCLESE